jgi:hypothetical protein
VRTFVVPSLICDSRDYVDMIDWQQCSITEPPMTRDYSDDFVDDHIQSKDRIEILPFPCHTQAVERYIKLVTEASAAVCGSKSRDGFIRARVQARQKMPAYETKSQFRC